MNWYLVRCKVCDDGPVMPFETVDERTQWVNIHRSAHVLESWDVWEEPRKADTTILDTRHQLVADDGLEIYPDTDYSSTNLLGTVPVIASRWELATYKAAAYPELVRENNIRIINEMTRKSRRVDEALAVLQIAARALLADRGPTQTAADEAGIYQFDQLQAAIDAIDEMMPVAEEEEE